MNNELNTGSLDTLTVGHCLLVDARIVGENRDKIGLHFAEIINTGSQPTSDTDQVNLLTHSMRYDENFSGGAQRKWLTTTPQAATEDYGIDFTDMNPNWYEDQKFGRMMDLNILDPFNEEKGRYVKVSIQETIVPSKWQEDNLQATCKTRGKGGDPITHKGDYVWRNTQAVGVLNINSPVTHVLLESDPVGVKLVEQEQVEITTESMVDEVESNEIGL